MSDEKSTEHDDDETPPVPERRVLLASNAAGVTALFSLSLFLSSIQMRLTAIAGHWANSESPIMPESFQDVARELFDAGRQLVRTARTLDPGIGIIG